MKNSDIRGLPKEYIPLSPWAYFGYGILFSIPFVGIICLFIFSLGGAKNINLRNYARSYFCVYVIALIIIIVFIVGNISLAGLFTLFK